MTYIIFCFGKVRWVLEPIGQNTQFISPLRSKKYVSIWTILLWNGRKITRRLFWEKRTGHVGKWHGGAGMENWEAIDWRCCDWMGAKSNWLIWVLRCGGTHGWTEEEEEEGEEWESPLPPPTSNLSREVTWEEKREGRAEVEKHGEQLKSTGYLIHLINLLFNDFR